MAQAARKGDSISGSYNEGSHYGSDHGGHSTPHYPWINGHPDPDTGEWIDGYYSDTPDYYTPDHPSGTISGSISSGSSNVYINGKQAARSGDNTSENDNCHTNQIGQISGGSSKVYINGSRVARQGDSINTHVGSYGSASITSGSSNVNIG